MTPEGVGTTAHIAGRFARGMIVEQPEREYTEVAQDERIVTKAHAIVRFAGPPWEVAHSPILTWLFEGDDGSTKVTPVVLEEDLSWIQSLLESVSAVTMGRTCTAYWPLPRPAWRARRRQLRDTAGRLSPPSR